MIDVVIPCRNAPLSLQMALTYFWQYGFDDRIASVTLLDNMSTIDDQMAAVMQEFARRPRHAIIRHERDVGVWTSINRGLALARSQYVLVLTSDVIIGPHMIDRLIKAQQITGLAYLGPDVAIGMRQLMRIYQVKGVYRPVPRYNGACWLMD